jgi:hypothetical protein
MSAGSISLSGMAATAAKAAYCSAVRFLVFRSGTSVVGFLDRLRDVVVSLKLNIHL